MDLPGTWQTYTVVSFDPFLYMNIYMDLPVIWQNYKIISSSVPALYMEILMD